MAGSRPYPPPRAMRALVDMIEQPDCVFRDGDSPHFLIGSAALGPIARMELADAELLADRGYLDLNATDGAVVVTPTGVEWATKWLRARHGREIRPHR